MNNGIFPLQASSSILEFPQGNLITDGRLATGVLLGKNNRIAGFTNAFVIGSDNVLVTPFLMGETNTLSGGFSGMPTQVPSLFVVGNGHQLGYHGVSYGKPGTQIIISPGVSYSIPDNSISGPNIIIDASPSTGGNRPKLIGQSGGNVVITTNWTSTGNAAWSSITCLNGIPSGSTATLIGFGATGSGTQNVSLGPSTTSNGTWSTAVGTFASSSGNSAVAIGVSSLADTTYSVAFNAGKPRAARAMVYQAGGSLATTGWLPTTKGSAQWGIYQLHKQTTDATQTELSAGTQVAAETRIVLGNDSCMHLRVSVCGIKTTSGGPYFNWTCEFMATRGATAASTALTQIGTPVITDPSTTGWAVALNADTTAGGIAMKVTGAAATTINWHARVDVDEVSMTV